MDIIVNLYYSGEKPPHMWWDEFEKEPEWAFTTYDLKEGCIVHSYEMILRVLFEKKIKVDFLGATKASLNIELSKFPLTLTYEVAVASFRNAVNQTHPPEMKPAGGRPRRNIRQTTTGRGNEVNITWTDSSTITLTNGQKIKYHPSFRFPTNVYSKFKPTDQERLRRERAEYRASKRMKSRIKELETQIASIRDDQSNITPPVREIAAMTTNISESVTLGRGSTIMGGRNKRSQQRNQTQS